MLVIAGGDRTRLDAGAVALAVARRLSETGRRLLFVDADATGSMLARRCGSAIGSPFAPAECGLPTLIASRDELRADTVAPHCYSIDSAEEPLWMLFAPESAAGGRFAAGWLAERVDDLQELARTRQVIVSAPSWQHHENLLPLLKNALALVLYNHVTNEKAAEALTLWIDSMGLSGAAVKQRMLLIDDESPLENHRVEAVTGIPVVGRLPFTEDEKLLRMRFKGRQAAFAASLDKICLTLDAALSHDVNQIAPVVPLPTNRGAADDPPAESPQADRRRWMFREGKA